MTSIIAPRCVQTYFDKGLDHYCDASGNPKFEINGDNRRHLSKVASVGEVTPITFESDEENGLFTHSVLVKFSKSLTPERCSDAHGGLRDFVKGMLGLSDSYAYDFDRAEDQFDTKMTSKDPVHADTNAGRRRPVEVEVHFANERDARWVKACLTHLQRQYAGKSPAHRQ